MFESSRPHQLRFPLPRTLGLSSDVPHGQNHPWSTMFRNYPRLSRSVDNPMMSIVEKMK